MRRPNDAPLHFDPLAHRYWVGTRELLAVTHVLAMADLVDMSWFTELSRTRGRAIHRLTEAFDRRESMGEVPIDLEPYLAAYQRFVMDTRPVWTGIETP